MQHLSLYLIGGFGHIKPALAISEQFQKHGIKSTTKDIFSLTQKPKLDQSLIYNTISKSPLLSPFWNLITRHDLFPSIIFEPFHWIEVLSNQQSINTLRRQYNPAETIITATHWTPALIAAKAFDKNIIFLYVTDIYVHGLWRISPPNVHYLVPMEETKIVLIEHGVKPENISLAPFPIHQEIINGQTERFKKRIQKLKSKNPSVIDVLVISGGAGTGKNEMKKLLDQFLLPAKTKQVKLTFLLSTKELRNHLRLYRNQVLGKNPQSIQIKSYTPHSLYSALNKAEVLITKAGGDITFESLSEGLPIYTLKDIGDHERLNRLYLEAIGASKPLSITNNPWDMIQADILTGEILLMAKASNQAGKFHRQNHIPQIIEYINHERRI